MGIDELRYRYDRGNYSKHGQYLKDGYLLGGLTINRGKSRSHLTIRQYISIQRKDGIADNFPYPADVQMHERQVYTPFMVAVDTAPCWLKTLVI